MSTPEGKVKAQVKRVLKKFESTTYAYMPVPGGFGERTLDYLGCNLGRAFAIETKRAGKAPTALQDHTIRRMERAGMKVFVIVGLDSPVLRELEEWLG